MNEFIGFSFVEVVFFVLAFCLLVFSVFEILECLKSDDDRPVMTPKIGFIIIGCMVVTSMLTYKLGVENGKRVKK